MDLAAMVKLETGSSSVLRKVPFQDVYPKGFEEVPRRVPDLSKLRSLLGTLPATPLSEIVRQVVADQGECRGASDLQLSAVD